MAFENRIVEHPGRIVLTEVDATNGVYDVDYTAEEGTVSQEGTLMDADSMNEAVQDLIDSSMNGISISAGGTVTVKNVQSGSITVTPRANTALSKNITFATPFEHAPQVVVTPNTASPQNCHVGVSAITTTGFTVTLYRTTAVSTTLRWIAVGM